MIDIAVVIAVMIVLAAILLPVLAATKHRDSRLNCVSNVKQIALAFRVWELDNNNKNPMAISVTNGGAMELIAAGNVAGCFQMMSNVLSTPKVLICPADTGHLPATDFQNDFNSSHISYFINPDARQAYPQMILSGDDNLAINGVPVKSGLVVLPSAAQVSWTAARHINVGNISFADGSFSEVSISGLQQALELSTNGTPTPIVRLAIP